MVFPGSVQKLHFPTIDRGYGRNKFCLTLFEGDRGNFRFFLINTSPTQFIQRRPSMMAGQVRLQQSHYGFLHHDSFLDCTEILGKPRAQIAQNLSDHPEWDCGTLRVADLERVRAVVTASEVLTPTEIQSILEGLPGN